MPIRLLITCGLLAVACPAFGQVHYYGRGAPVYDNHAAPYYDSHGDDGHSGHAFHPHAYSRGYHSSRAPLPYQYGTFQYATGPSHQAFGYGDLNHAHGAPFSSIDSCSGTSVCPLQNGYAYADSPQQYQQYGDRQYGSSQSHDGHVHDESHAHEGLSSTLEPDGDIWRQQPMPRNQVPFRDQAAPRMQTVPPSDRQPFAPPSLPPSSLSSPSRPDQIETPLGDGPPPNTVPMSPPQWSS